MLSLTPTAFRPAQNAIREAFVAKPELFWNRENEFKIWLSKHQGGYLLNCYKTGEAKGEYKPYMLHRASCGSFSGNNRFD